MSERAAPTVTERSIGTFVVTYEPPGGWRDSADSDAFARLLAAAPEMLDVILAVEWVGKFSHEYCPWCANPRQVGHRNDCARRVLLEQIAGMR
jgi:hypothetical protein